MGANLGSRHAMVAQGSPAARSPAPYRTGVTPNHHTDRLKACLEIEVGRLSTAVSRFIAFICVTAVLLGASLAFAEKRVALVIGNGAYHKVGRLANPTNDAKAISGMLQSAGFDNVAL